MEKQLNKKYMASHALNSGMLAAMLAFSSIFLLDKGLSNSSIGILLALCSVASIGIQTFFANFTNKHESIQLQDMLTALLMVIIVSSTFLLFIPSVYIFLFVVMITYSFAQSSTPFVNSLAFIYEDQGIQIKYGLARGIGSLSYALITLMLGFVIEKTTPSILPLFYIGIALLFILVVRSYSLPKNKLKKLPLATTEEEAKETRKDSIPISEQSLASFLVKYRELVLMIIGLAFVLFAQTTVSTFFIQIVTPLGGDSSSVGLAIFIAAAVEVPIMMNFDRLTQKRSTTFWLKVSTLFFVTKIVILFFATNLTMVYVSQFLQFGSYALAYPAVVQYIKEKVEKKDLFKGQTLFTIGTTVSSVFASLLGGILIDHLGVSQMIFVALAATIIGGLIIIKTLENASEKAYEVVKAKA